MRTDFPRAASAPASASCDPTESPSGRTCEEITKRRRSAISSRMRSTTSWSVLFAVIVIVCRRRCGLSVGFVDLLDQPLDPVLAFDRLVEDELEDRHAPQTQPLADLVTQEGRGPAEGAARVPAGRRVAERRVVHAGKLQVTGH